MSVYRYIHIYLAVYGPEIIGSFDLKEKSKKKNNKRGLQYRKNKLWQFADVRPPIIDPLYPAGAGKSRLPLEMS